MNLTRQLVRGTAALVLGGAFGACAIAQNADADATDAHAAPVAHSRLAIVAEQASGTAQRWVVAGVRVGDPVAQTNHDDVRVAMRTPSVRNPRS
ncbi:MAG TPA: hypothetical protein VFB32_12070 [Rudaea sp.]|nr:hypothetical protein [Rudaea sp.]